MIGHTLDRYKIVDELGHGGMSTVYRGIDEALEREVAIKVLHEHLAKSLENRKRFHREAKAIARLKHPNILEIYDYSSYDAIKSFIVTELVDGVNFRQFISKFGRMSSEITALVGLEICKALSHAHQSGVIHRDLKPENVMVSRGGNIKLMDFGIAHVIGAETMTQTGSLLGSPAHIPPELIDGQPVDIRSDIYSLGTILYYLATGKLPYDGANAPQVFKRVLTGEFDDPELISPKVGGAFGKIIRKCMSKDPGARYLTVDALEKSLKEFLKETNLDDPTELENYFRAPETYHRKFAKRIVPRLLIATKRSKKEHALPKLVDYFNRILAYDPDNEEVKAMMASLGRRKITKNAIVGIAGLALVFLSLYFWNVHREPLTTSLPATTGPAPIATPSTKTPPVFPNVDTVKQAKEAAQFTHLHARQHAALIQKHKNELLAKANSKPNRIEPKKHVSPNDATQSTTHTTTPIVVPKEKQSFVYRFSVIPGGASFLIDGKTIDVLRARRGITLMEGKHRVVVSSPGAETFTRTIEIKSEQKKIFPVVLQWKPGRIQVVSNTHSVVWIGNAQKLRRIQPKGRNATFRIPFGRADEDEAKKRITIRVASTEDMGHPKVQSVLVKPGQLTTINVNF